MLNLGTGGHREVGPELDRLARTQRRHDDVRAVVVAALDVHADDGVGCHPGIVGDVGLETNGGGGIAVVGQGAVERGHLIGGDGVAVERVVALHVNGVIGDAAHTEMDEVVHVEPFTGHAAVGREEHGEGVGTAAKEDLRVGEVGDLLPCDLRVPRQVGPLAGSGAGVTLGDVPRDGFERVVNVAGSSPEFHGDRITGGHAAPSLNVELARDKLVGVEEHSAQPRLVGLTHAGVKHVGVTLTA